MTQGNILWISMPRVIYSKEHHYTVAQIKKAREEAGLDQVMVAKMLGRTQSYISKIESGQRRIDVIVLQEFARIYKKPVEWFLK